MRETLVMPAAVGEGAIFRHLAASQLKTEHGRRAARDVGDPERASGLASLAAQGAILTGVKDAHACCG